MEKSQHTELLGNEGQVCLELEVAHHVNLPAAVTGEVEVARLIFAEGGDAVGGIRQLLGLPARPVVLQSPDAPGAVVRVEIHALHEGIGRTAIDEAARDGTANRIAWAMVVFRHRGFQRERRAGSGKVVVVRSFLTAPAIVLTARARGRLIVPLFPRVLPNVPDVEVSRLPVE